MAPSPSKAATSMVTSPIGNWDAKSVISPSDTTLVCAAVVRSTSSIGSSSIIGSVVVSCEGALSCGCSSIAIGSLFISSLLVSSAKISCVCEAKIIAAAAPTGTTKRLIPLAFWF